MGEIRSLVDLGKTYKPCPFPPYGLNRWEKLDEMEFNELANLPLHRKGSIDHIEIPIYE